MAEVKADIFVSAPLQKAFDIFTDIPNAAARLSGVTKLEAHSDGPVGPGFKWTETRTLFGREASETMTVAEFSPPEFMTVEAFSHGTAYRTRFDFAPQDGGTKVAMTFSATPKSLFARIMSIFSGAMMGSVEKLLLKDLQDMKAAAEAAAEAAVEAAAPQTASDESANDESASADAAPAERAGAPRA
ncbi:MAG: hypothetical protein Tsb0010_16910 [Parvularculaceae bacterium]